MSTGDAPTGREHLVTEAFVSLANSLVGRFDEVELLNGLTTDCTRLLDVDAAGLLLADRNGVLHVVAASSERTRNLELFQLQRDEGPCLDCFHSGRPTSVKDLRLEVDRWPEFVPAAIAAGFASVDAIPLRLLDDVLGAIGLFGSSTGSLNGEDLDLAQALAHVAAVAIGVGAVGRKSSVPDQLPRGATEPRGGGAVQRDHRPAGGSGDGRGVQSASSIRSGSKSATHRGRSSTRIASTLSGASARPDCRRPTQRIVVGLPGCSCAPLE